ncbi:MAG: asparagine synthetase B, partial [bacterium]|nr:asparagine synthetase B [bacterium]
HCYWELSFAAKTSLSFRDSRDEMSALIESAVVDRLMSEVPLGAFLSGGIDSSLIVAYMQKNAARQIKTYAVGFDAEMFDETAAAQTVAGTSSV